jgi:sugar phosphate isomerase/epimerase
VHELSLAPGAGVSIHGAADLDRYLGAVAGAGFGAVSLALDQVAGDAGTAARLLEAHGLRCHDLIGLQVGRDDAEALGSAQRLADTAGVLGAGHVLALLFTRVSSESIDRLGRCADVVAGAGAQLALEMPPIGPLDSIGAALAVVDAVGAGSVSLVVDTFHFFRGSSTWSELESLPLEALGYVQFDDALPVESEDVMYETTQRRCMPGDGELDLERFVGTLVGRGWSGVVSVEVLSAELRSLDPADFARLAFRSTVRYWDGGPSGPT